MLNNKGALPLYVTPTFYSSGGTELRLAPIIVNGASYRDIDLRELLADAGQEFREGNLRMTYQGKMMQLGSQVKLIDENNSLIWEEQFVEPAAKYKSSQLEGVWWMPSNNCDTKFIISNTTDAPVTATITVDGTSPGQKTPTAIQLNAHETRVLDVIRDLVRKNNGTIHTTGGVSISHTGAAGAILARMLISKANKGFSSTMNFIDPEMTASSRWHGTGLHLGSVNNQKLQQILVARNVGNETTTVSGKIPYTNNDGEVVTINIPLTNIAPNSTKTINLQSAIDAANVPASVKYAGLEMSYTTAKGSVVMSAVSVSADNNQVFQVPLYDPQKTASSAGGYPWKADGDFTTVVYIKNDTDQPQQYIARMVYPGGFYMLGLKDLKPREMAAIDFRSMRDNLTPDAMGNTIPLNLSKGQILWSAYGAENHILNGRSEQISLTDGVSSTYDCRNCCMDSIAIDGVFPGSVQTFIGDFTNFAMIGSIYSCYGQRTPYLQSNGNWTSSDYSIANINSNGVAEAMSVGDASMNVSWTSYTWYNQSYGGNDCRRADYPGYGSGMMMVRPRITSISPSRGGVGSTTSVTINGSGFRSGVTINQMTGITVSNVAFVSSTKITADFKIASDATGGNRSVSVTISGQLSNTVNFFVQIPTSLSVVSITVLPSGNDEATSGCRILRFGDHGIIVSIKYQVKDQDGNSITNDKMVGQETITDAVYNGTSQGDPKTEFVDITPSRTISTRSITDKNGQFVDAPFGACGTEPFVYTFIQKIRILIDNTQITYNVRTNSITVTGSSAGTGSVSNSSDISKNRN